MTTKLPLLERCWGAFFFSSSLTLSLISLLAAAEAAAGAHVMVCGAAD